MLKKLLLPVLCISAVVAYAEPQRTALTYENKFPELHHLELGYDFVTREFGDYRYTDHDLVARFGLVDNLTVHAALPYEMYSPDWGTKERGIGDVQLGLNLVAYQDVFTFPYVAPHADVWLPTGDEDKNLGSGDTLYKFGVAFGTKTHEMFDWVLDVSYGRDYDAKVSETDNMLEVALSFIWALSDQFALSLEGLARDYDSTDNQPFLVGGGFSYKFSPDFQFRFFMGGWQQQESGEDLNINLNAAYSF